MKPFHETTTLAVRMVKSEADAITRLARERAVPVSSLLRTWIVDGYIHETGDSVSSTIADLEQVVRRLRRELKHG
jgi:transposase-like protein